MDGNSDIYTMDLENRVVEKITNHPSIDTSPSFSPDGKYICFNSDRSGRRHLYITSLDGKKANITFTIKREDLDKTLNLIEKDKEKLNYNKITHDDKLAKVSIIGAGMIANPGVTYKMFRSLADEKINILAISTSEIKISVHIKEDLTQKAVKTLHKTFGLN